MTAERVRAPHPRREAIGRALARAIPVAGDRADRKLLRRMDIAEAVRR